MKQQYKSRLYPAVLFLFALFARFVVYWQPVLYKIRRDDFGPLIYPAFLAGVDWRQFVSGGTLYYGYGYYWIFAPLFKFITAQKLLLVAIVGINAMLIALTSVFIYFMLVRYLSFPHSFSTAVFAFIPTVFLGQAMSDHTVWYRTDNETSQFFACWLLVWLLFKANKIHEDRHASSKDKTVIAIAVALVLNWSLTLHERSMALLLAFVLVELLLFAIKREWLVKPIPFFIALIVGFLAQRYLRSAIIHVMWLGGWPEKNTSVLSRVNLWFLESLTSLKTLMFVVIGNLHTFTICAFGLPAFAAVTVIAWLLAQLPPLRERMGSLFQGEGDELIPSPILIMLVFGLCTMIIIAGHAIRWGLMLYPHILKNEIDFAYRGLCYNRYYYVYCGPIVLGLFAHLYMKKTFPRTLAEISLLTWSAIEVSFFAFVYPYIVIADERTGADYVRRALGIYVLDNISNGKRMFLAMASMAVALILLTVFIVRSQNANQRTSEGRHIRRKDASSSAQKQARRGMPYLVATALFMTAVIVFSRVHQVDLANGPSLTFGDIGDVAATVSQLEDDGALPENIHTSTEGWSNTLCFLTRDIPYWRGYPSAEELANDNLIVAAKKSDGSRYLEAGYEAFDIGKYTLYTNNDTTAAGLSHLLYDAM